MWDFVLCTTVVLTVGVIVALLLTRRIVKWQLENYAKLPTVLWTPRFVNYEDGKMSKGSSITKILPRMERMRGDYGMFATVYGFNTKVVHIAHPVPARIVLGATASESASSSLLPRKKSDRGMQLGALKRPGYNNFLNFTGNGVFTADGEEWREKRASVIHSMFRGSQSSFAEHIEAEANMAADFFMGEVECLKDEQSHVVSSYLHSKSIPEFDVVPLLQRSTIGMIYRYVTQDASFMSPPAVRNIKRDAKSVLSREEMRVNEYLSSVTRIRMIVLAQARSFWFLLPRIFYVLFSPMFQEEEDTLRPIRQFAKQACANARPGSPLDVLRNRKSHQRSTSKVCQKKGEPYLSKDMIDETITLLFAGQDTSAATLSWTLHLLSLHPEIQKKLYDEVCEVFNENGDEEKKEDSNLRCSNFISKKAASSLKYLDAVIKESMRLYPVAPFVVRALPHDVPVPDCETVLMKGSLACVWIYGLHRNKAMWDRPDEFIPERWLDPELRQRDVGQTEGAYMPFAVGPRSCLGQSIGTIVLRIMLSRIVNQYEVTDRQIEHGANSDKVRKDMQAGFTVLPTGGVHLRLRPRQSVTCSPL